MKRKQMLALCLCLWLGLSLLTGCQDTGVEDETTTDVHETETDAYSEYRLTQPTTIEFWYRGGANAEFWETIIKEFNALSEQTLVTVVGTEVGLLSECKLNLSKAHKAKEGVPALVTLEYSVAQSLYQDRVLSDIAELMAANGFDFSGLIDEAVAQVVVGDCLVGVPWDVAMTVYYFNRTELEKHGLNAIPTTWDEFKVWAKAVYEATGVPAVGISSKDAGAGTELLQSFGVDQSVSKELTELVDAGYVVRIDEVGEIIPGRWLSGEMMSCRISTRFYQEYLDMMKHLPEEMQFEIGLALNRSGEGSYPSVDGCALCVPELATQQEKNAAGIFLSWLGSMDNHARWAEGTDGLLIHRENIQNAELLERLCEELPGLKTGVYPYLEQ